MSEENAHSRELVRALNDGFRRSFVGGLALVSAGVEDLPAERKRAILAQVRAFAAFDEDDDPNGERDLGVVEDAGVRCLWKIDRYDREMESLSPDPADPALTTRVLSVTLVDEY